MKSKVESKKEYILILSQNEVESLCDVLERLFYTGKNKQEADKIINDVYDAFEKMLEN